MPSEVRHFKAALALAGSLVVLPSGWTSTLNAESTDDQEISFAQPSQSVDVLLSCNGKVCRPKRKLFLPAAVTAIQEDSEDQPDYSNLESHRFFDHDYANLPNSVRHTDHGSTSSRDTIHPQFERFRKPYEYPAEASVHKSSFGWRAPRNSLADSEENATSSEASAVTVTRRNRGGDGVKVQNRLTPIQEALTETVWDQMKKLSTSSDESCQTHPPPLPPPRRRQADAEVIEEGWECPPHWNERMTKSFRGHREASPTGEVQFDRMMGCKRNYGPSLTRAQSMRSRSEKDLKLDELLTVSTVAPREAKKPVVAASITTSLFAIKGEEKKPLSAASITTPLFVKGSKSPKDRSEVLSPSSKRKVGGWFQKLFMGKSK